jgi:hypothetical protein
VLQYNFLFNVVELVKSFLNLDIRTSRSPLDEFVFAEAPPTQVAPLSIRGQTIILDFCFAFASWHIFILGNKVELILI